MGVVICNDPDLLEWSRATADGAVTVEYPLPCGSLLYMTAEVQAGWKHAILPRPGAGGRISLTFRRLKAE